KRGSGPRASGAPFAATRGRSCATSSASAAPGSRCSPPTTRAASSSACPRSRRTTRGCRGYCCTSSTTRAGRPGLGPGPGAWPSPELLFSLAADGTLEARPIAGTRPRDADPAELLADPKERAEHVMLVDLARNDLGRVCEFGTVRVPRLLDVESYRTVHHLVSTVQADLAPGLDVVDAFRALFPGGTITGAPKVRAMEIIEELEPVRRGVYTGSLGWLAPD